MMSLSDTKQAGKFTAFNVSSKYVDNLKTLKILIRTTIPLSKLKWETAKITSKSMQQRLGPDAIRTGSNQNPNPVLTPKIGNHKYK